MTLVLPTLTSSLLRAMESRSFTRLALFIFVSLKLVKNGELASLPASFSCNTHEYWDNFTSSCQPCLLCPPGEEPLTTCTTTRNTMCKPCAPNKYSNFSSLTEPCHFCSALSCTAQQLYVRQCTSYQDTTCDQCGTERYLWKGTDSCLFCPVCQPDEAEVIPCGLHSKRTCRHRPTAPNTVPESTSLPSTVQTTSDKSKVQSDTVPTEELPTSKAPEDKSNAETHLLLYYVVIPLLAVMAFLAIVFLIYYGVNRYINRPLTRKSQLSALKKGQRKALIQKMALYCGALAVEITSQKMDGTPAQTDQDTAKYLFEILKKQNKTIEDLARTFRKLRCSEALAVLQDVTGDNAVGDSPPENLTTIAAVPEVNQSPIPQTPDPENARQAKSNPSQPDVGHTTSEESSEGATSDRERESTPESDSTEQDTHSQTFRQGQFALTSADTGSRASRPRQGATTAAQSESERPATTKDEGVRDFRRGQPSFPGPDGVSAEMQRNRSDSKRVHLPGKDGNDEHRQTPAPQPQRQEEQIEFAAANVSAFEMPPMASRLTLEAREDEPRVHSTNV